MEEQKPEQEDTQETDVMQKILEKLSELCELQKEHGEQIKDILERLSTLDTQVEFIREAQIEHGKVVAALKQTCDERPFKCKVRSSDTPPPREATSGV